MDSILRRVIDVMNKQFLPARLCSLLMLALVVSCGRTDFETNSTESIVVVNSAENTEQPGSVTSADRQSTELHRNSSPIVLFQENFDDQADWTSGDAAGAPTKQYVGDGIPSEWFMVRQTPKWAPSKGFPNKNEAIELLYSNSDKARGGVGKSAVFWRESRDNFANDKTMLYKFDEGQDSVYVEFYLRFSPDWTTSTSGGNFGKVFRVYAWDDVNSTDPFVFFSRGNAGPMYIWDYQVNKYGVRNIAALRGGPYGENYAMSTPLDFPRNFVAGSLGSASLNFTKNTVGQAVGGGTPKIPDLVNGGFISDDLNQTVLWDQVFGSPASQTWTKMAYYVSLNSAPGAADGVLSQWINDERVLHNSNIPWVGATDEDFDRVKWNLIGIGGNDKFSVYPESEQRKEWYAIDDLQIYDSVPNYLTESSECS